MSRKLKASPRKRILIFPAACGLCILLWLPVKGYYAAGVSYGAAQAVSVLQDVSYKSLATKPGSTVVTFEFPPYRSRVRSISYGINSFAYDFSVPLILALLLTLAPLVTPRWRSILGIVGLTVAIHLLYVIFCQYQAIETVLAREEGRMAGQTWTSQYPEWFSLLALRFLPFLFGFYLVIHTSLFKEWVRERSANSGRTVKK